MTTDTKQFVVLDGFVARMWGGKFVKWEADEGKAFLRDFYSWLAARGLSYASNRFATSREQFGPD